MKTTPGMIRQLGETLRSVFKACEIDDQISAMQREAVDRNLKENQRNTRVSDATNVALSELIAQMETKRRA